MTIECEPYKAYCDGSKGHKPGKILLLSALVHTVTGWEKFAGEWELALAEKPSIKHFHMREARKLEGNFKGWKATDRDLKVMSLSEVVLHNEPHAISVWVSADAYNATIRAVAPSDLRHVFSLAFQGIMQTVAEYQIYRNISIPTDFVFDEEGEIGNEALMWYPMIKHAVPSEVRALLGATPAFRKDEEVLPLQAADLVAWQKRRKKEVSGLDSESVASQRIDELPGGEREITKESLIEMAEKMAKVPHVEMFRDTPSMYKKIKYALRTGKKEI